MEQKRKQLKKFPQIKVNRAFLDKMYARKMAKIEKLKRLMLNNYE